MSPRLLSLWLRECVIIQPGIELGFSYGAITLFLAEPAPTAWDLHFRLFGIPVRISPWFWVSNILLGWAFAQSVAQGSGGSVNVGMALAIWTSWPCWFRS